MKPARLVSGVVAPTSTEVIHARGASVRFGDRLLWSAVDLDIGPGTFTAILGPNGAGKSTLLKVLLGLQPLSAGTVSVLGAPAGAARRRIGYVPQRSGFDPTLRIRGLDVVRMGLDGSRWGVPLPGRRARRSRDVVREMVELVGGSHYANRP